jgi:putative two-component system response regulator
VTHKKFTSKYKLQNCWEKNMFNKNVNNLNKGFLETIRLLAKMAEIKEWDNTNHLERIRVYCSILASGLGYSQQEVEIISYASILHDVGKIGLSDSILQKKKMYSSFELEEIEKHTKLGAGLLQGSTSPILQMGAQIALTHHERWDGSGYPNGLVKGEVPTPGKICAVADVFDALTTRRPYKKEISNSEALQLLHDNSGKLFDPAIIGVFEKHFKEIIKVKETYAE